MSVKLSVVRLCSVTQVDSYNGEIADTTRTYRYCEVIMHGFTGRTRCKSKRFSNMQAAYAYLNKLHAGGWMSDDDYCKAWDACLKLHSSLVDSPDCVQLCAEGFLMWP